jgi:predicted lipoprotein with Yx(FWY)xxD motif
VRLDTNNAPIFQGVILMKSYSGYFKAALLAASLSCPLSLSFAQTASPSPSASPVVGQVSIATGSLGSYLADSNGRSLYLFEADTSSTSTCTGACATAWPPFVVPSGQTPTIATSPTSSSIQSSLLATSARSDGTTQVTYNGHPLYYFSGDTGPGTTAGQGLNEFGALWYLVQASGQALIQASGSASPSPSPTAPAAGGSPY